MLYTILYVSRAAKKMYDSQLNELLIQSREWNRTHGITGFLGYVEETFKIEPIITSYKFWKDQNPN